MKHLVFLFWLLIPCIPALAQDYSIRGIILDPENEEPLPGAHIRLNSEGIPERTSISNDRGRFRIDRLTEGNYTLTISFVGYEDYLKIVSIKDQNIALGSILLQASPNELGEIEVTEKILPAVQLGDTTQFNSDAYKTNPDATAEDLIRKMPGIEVENGKVKAEGEDVKEVLVDGRPFFGNDPNAALRNLPAEVIKSIQVFDQQSDQSQFTGFEDGETSKTINIITRSDMRNGQFGNAFAGYGTDDRYRLGGTVNFFNKDQRISLIGQSNNINQQNFSTEDLLGVVGGSNRRGRGGGRGGGRGRGSSVNDFLVDQSGGISKTHALGLNYNDEWGKKAEVNLSYFFNRSDNTAVSSLDRQYIEGESINQVYEEFNDNNSRNSNHRLNGRMDFEIDEKNSIRWRPSLSFQLNDGSSFTDAQTLEDSSLLNQTNNLYRSDLSAFSLSNQLLWRHRMKKARRTLSLSVRTTYEDSKGESFLNSLNVYQLRGNTQLDTLDQFSDLTVDGWTYRANLSYTEPVGQKGMLSLNLRSSYETDESDRRVFELDESSQQYSLLNSDLSNVFSNKYFSQQAGISYNLRQGRSGFFMFRGTFQLAQLQTDQEFPALYSGTRNFFNFLPMAIYRLRVSKQKNLRIFYRSRTDLPAIEQLQNVVDNSNPLQLSIGNPALGQSIQHSLFVRYNETNTEKSTVFYFLLGGEYGLDYISNSTYLANSDHPVFADPAIQEGAQLIQPVNLDGYLNLRSFVTYGFPVAPLKSNLNTTVSINHTRIPGLINEVLNYSNNTTSGLSLVLSSNISERFDFTLGSKSNFSLLSNSLQDQQDNNYFNQQSSLALTWIIWKGLVVRTNLTHQYFGGLSDQVDDNFLLWNAEIGKKIFKNQRGEIKLSVFDLLNQNTSIQRTVTDVYFEDRQTQVLQRYLMLSFVYQLRHFGKARPKEEERKKDRDWRWKGN